MSAKRVVLTGYEPWAHASKNPTLDILDRAREHNFPNIELVTIPVPAVSDKITPLVDAALDEYRPDVWLSLGLYPGLAVIGVERTAVNVADFPVVDNAGAQPHDKPVFAEGPTAYNATLPIKAIVGELTAHSIPAKVSNTASTYLCNQIMYSALHLVEQKGLDTRAGFIHVPHTPDYVASADYPEHEFPSMSLDMTSEAVGLALTISAEQESDIKAPPKGY